MVYTLTLNPAIDKAVYLDGLTLDRVNRITHTRSNAGGKGINVSRALKKMGVPSVACAFAGGAEGDMLRQLCLLDGVHARFSTTAAPTRINVKIVDTKNDTFTDLNEPGGPVTGMELSSLLSALYAAVRPGDTAVLSGSIPAGLPCNVYQTITGELRQRQVFVAADCDGQPLAHCVQAFPNLIKPNNFELSALMGRPLSSIQELTQAAAQLVRQGVETVLITLGGDGALSVSSRGVWHAAGLSVPVLSTVGAGDTFLAGYLKAHLLEEDPRQALCRAMAASTAKVQKEGTDMPSEEEMELFLSQVSVTCLQKSL